MGNTKILARAASASVLEELRGRSGFKHLIESLELDDLETYLEIEECIAKIIAEHYENHVLY